MNKLVIIAATLIVLPFFSFSQSSNDSLRKSLHNAPIPSFSILKTDSSWFSSTELPRDKPVIIIYFSPECSHCQAKAKFVAERMDSLKNTFLLWASYFSLDKIKDFSEKFGLSKFNNVVFGRDTHYFLPTYFKTTTLPYIAIYNSKGLFSKEFRNGTTVHDIIIAANNE
jgi:thiol-disulfide isomerase/thioredoxin